MLCSCMSSITCAPTSPIKTAATRHAACSHLLKIPVSEERLRTGDGGCHLLLDPAGQLLQVAARRCLAWAQRERQRASSDLEAGPEQEVDTVQVVVEAGDAALVHNELVVVVHADHQQQRHQVIALLPVPAADLRSLWDPVVCDWSLRRAGMQCAQVTAHPMQSNAATTTPFVISANVMRHTWWLAQCTPRFSWTASASKAAFRGASWGPRGGPHQDTRRSMQ